MAGELTVMSLVAKFGLDATDYNQGIKDAQDKADEFTSPTADPLTIDTKEYVDNLETAETTSSTFKDTVGEIFAGIAGKLAAAGVTALISGFVDAINNLMDLAKNLGKDISEGAEQLGVSTKAYQVWDRVLQRAGGSASDLSDGIESINTLLKGPGDGEEPDEAYTKAANAFEKLGVSATDADGNLRSVEDILSDTVIALAQVEDSAEKADLTEALFGGNNNVGKLLKENAADIQYWKRAAGQSVLSDKQIESSVRYNNALEDMNTALNDLKQTVTVSLLEPLTNVVDAMTTVMNFFNPDNWRDKSAQTQFKDIDDEATAAAFGLEATAAQAESLIDKMLALPEATERTVEQQRQWRTYADWLIKNIPSLRNEIDLETGTISGEADALKENVQQWKERQKALILQQALSDKRLVVAQKLSTAIDKQTELDMQQAEADGARAKAVAFLNEQLEKNPEFRQRFESEYTGPTTVDQNGNKIIDANQLQLTSTEENPYAIDNLEALQGLYYQSVGDTDEYWNTFNPMVGQAADQAEDIAAAAQQAKDAMEDYQSSLALYEQGANSAQTILGSAEESADTAATKANSLAEAINNIPDKKDVFINIIQNGDFSVPDGSHASGAWTIPYDDYIARLHRGETVLTASQSRQMKNGGSSLDMDSLVSGIVGAVQTGMAGATVNSYLNGKSITQDVSRNTIQQTKARRFAP